MEKENTEFVMNPLEYLEFKGLKNDKSKKENFLKFLKKKKVFFNETNVETINKEGVINE